MHLLALFYAQSQVIFSFYEMFSECRLTGIEFEGDLLYNPTNTDKGVIESFRSNPIPMEPFLIWTPSQLVGMGYNDQQTADVLTIVIHQTFYDMLMAEGKWV